MITTLVLITFVVFGLSTTLKLITEKGININIFCVTDRYITTGLAPLITHPPLTGSTIMIHTSSVTEVTPVQLSHLVVYTTTHVCKGLLKSLK